MAAAGAALLRSVATKMARAPPRLPSALERHGRLPASSRFSTSTGSTPQPTNLRGPQTDLKKVRSGNEWDRAKTAAIETTTTLAFVTVVGDLVVSLLYAAGLIQHWIVSMPTWKLVKST